MKTIISAFNGFLCAKLELGCNRVLNQSIQNSMLLNSQFRTEKWTQHTRSRAVILFLVSTGNNFV